MKTFDRAMEVLLDHEKGYVNNPKDPGGATNFGISIRYARQVGDLDGDGFAEFDLDRDGDIDIEDIRKMKPEDAIKEYRRLWDKYHYDRLMAPVAIKIFDLAINMWFPAAHKVLQRALWSMGQRVAIDGILGQETIRATNIVNIDCLMAAIRSEAAAYYRSIVAKNPKMEWALNGWINRAMS